MQYYNELMKKARACYKLMKTYEAEGNLSLARAFAAHGADYCRKAKAIQENT